MIIDMQHEFVDRSNSWLIAPISDFSTMWMARGLPVIATRFVNTPRSQFVWFLDWSGAMEDTIVEELANVDNISKHSYSAFSDARVLEILRDQKVDTLVLCGVDTDACVMATALSAFDLGLRPLVLSDLCASSGGDDYHLAALMLLERNIGHRQISTSKDVMAEIDSSRG